MKFENLQLNARKIATSWGGYALATAMMFTTFASAQSTEITFWNPFTGPNGATIENMIADFNSTVGQEEGIRVNMLIVPWDDYYTKLTVAISSGNAPDLAINHLTRIPAYADQGALQSFTPEQLQAAGVREDNFIPEMWETSFIDGELYGIPMDAFPRFLWYNKELFREAGLDPEAPPQNLEELISAAEEITSLGGDTWGLWFAKEGSWVARDFYTIYFQLEPNLLASDQLSLAEGFAQAATKVFDITTSFTSEYGVAPRENVDNLALFGQNKIGMMIAQITDLVALQEVNGLDFAAAPMPVLGEQAATFYMGEDFVIPRSRNQNDESTNATLNFIRWFSENSIDWVKGGVLPASLTVMNGDELAALGPQSVAASQLDYMKLPPIIVESADIDRIIQETGEAIYAGNMSVDEGVLQMTQQINQILSR